jgi:hypothetical protein
MMFCFVCFFCWSGIVLVPLSLWQTPPTFDQTMFNLFCTTIVAAFAVSESLDEWATAATCLHASHGSLSGITQ